jgi:F0F1-type ATP synthase epsilon subunit
MSTISVPAILAVRSKRLSLQREADLLEQEEKALTNALIEAMAQEGRDTYEDGGIVVNLVTTDEPLVDSWPKLLDYIVENGAVDLLQKRVTVSAVKARWKDDVNLPGVLSVPKHSIKFNV